MANEAQRLYTILNERLTATRATNLDELDFDLDARLGSPAGASISADLVTIDNFVDNLESRLGTPGAGTVAGDVESIETKVGANTDVAGTGTLFARLKQIVDNYLASGAHGLSVIETYVDCLPASLGNLVTKDWTDILSDSTAFKGAQVDKLAGASPVVGTATENWNAAEANIVSIGANNTKNKLHSLCLNVSALTATATVTIRLYMQVNGVERQVYEEDFIVDTDPDGLWVVDGTLALHEVLRVTAESDNAGDDGKAINYDYQLEVM